MLFFHPSFGVAEASVVERDDMSLQQLCHLLDDGDSWSQRSCGAISVEVKYHPMR